MRWVMAISDESWHCFVYTALLLLGLARAALCLQPCKYTEDCSGIPTSLVAGALLDLGVQVTFINFTSRISGGQTKPMALYQW